MPFTLGMSPLSRPTLVYPDNSHIENSSNCTYILHENSSNCNVWVICCISQVYTGTIHIEVYQIVIGSGILPFITDYTPKYSNLTNCGLCVYINGCTGLCNNSKGGY